LKAVIAACRRRGMRDGDDTSFWDWIEPGQCEEQMEKRTFFEAVFAAKAVLKFDVVGEVRIARQVLVNDHDDLGNVFKGKSWEDDCVWHVHDEADQLIEDAPEYRAEAA
jgi:hypothetical protein